MEAKIITIDAVKIMGCKGEFTPAKGDFTGIDRAWESFFLLDSGEVINRMQSNQFWGVTYNTNKSIYSYIAGVLVSSVVSTSDKTASFETKKQKYALFEHHGHPQKMGDTIRRSIQWIENSKHELSDSFNLEMYDERCNPDQLNSYIVELYFPVK